MSIVLEKITKHFGNQWVVDQVSLEVAETWGRLNATARLSLVDGLMAATALVHDWTFVPRNHSDVERTGVRLLNPFWN